VHARTTALRVLKLAVAPLAAPAHVPQPRGTHRRPTRPPGRSAWPAATARGEDGVSAHPPVGNSVGLSTAPKKEATTAKSYRRSRQPQAVQITSLLYCGMSVSLGLG
jgi:hypothetical protein